VRGIYYFPKRLCSRLLAARDKTTPPTILGALACDVHEEVRLGVAGNPATPKCVWVILLEDPNSSVRAEVAARQDVEHEHLIKISLKQFGKWFRLEMIFAKMFCEYL
jgi:hypothetical protein